MWWNLIALLVATPPQMDLGAVAARAREVSHAAQREGAAIDLARAERRRSLQRLNPALGLSARYTRISEEDPIVIDPGIPGISVSIPGPKPDQWAFGFSVTFPLSDWLTRRSAIADASGSAIEASQALRQAAERRASLEAMLAHLNLVRIVRAEEVARQSLADAERRQGEVVRRIEARVASDADLRLAEVDLAERRQALASLGHSKQLVLTQLASLLDLEGVTAERFVLELPPLAIEPTASPADTKLELLMEEAWRRRPEPQALNEQERALSARARLAGVQRLPRLDLAAQAQLVDPNPRTIDQETGLVGIWDVSAVLSWSLDGLWLAETDERGLAAERASLEADRRALEDGLRLEIASALTSLADSNSQRDSAQAMVSAAAEGYRVRFALFQSALSTATELAEAETRLAAARLALVDAEVGVRVGLARLDHALGRPL